MTRLTTTALRFGLLGVLAATSACATVSPTVSARERFLATLDSLGYDIARTGSPRVRVSSETEQLHSRRIIPRLHVAEDAYVVLVNVWPSGDASVIYPESPADTGFLAGGRTYVMSSVFSGFATMFPPAGAQGLRYVRYGRSSDARVGARGPGYLVLIASRSPLDLTALDTAGLFDGVQLMSSMRQMEPSAIAPWIAVLASGGNPAVTIDHARYGGYDVMSFASASSSSLLASRSGGRCGFGHHGTPALDAWDASFGAAGCGAGVFELPLTRRPPMLRPLTPPRDTIKGPADTLHTPEARSAEVRAAWSALVDQNAARAAVRELLASDDIVELPPSRERQAPDDVELRRPNERQALDEAQLRRSRHRHALDDVQDGRVRGARAGRAHESGRNDRAPEATAPAPPRREEARPQPAPRAEPPRRADPAPRHVDPAPRQQPAERPRSDPRPEP